MATTTTTTIASSSSSSSNNNNNNNNSHNENIMDDTEDLIVINPDEVAEERGEKRKLEDTKGKKPSFAPIKPGDLPVKIESRKIIVPDIRMAAVRRDWVKIYEPIVEHMKLQIRMNPKVRKIEMRTSQHTTDIGALQKSVDYLRAYILGFEVADAVALLRLEDIYIDSFIVEDVKMLKGDHLSRAIGRILGKGGKTKFTIENTTKTRIVMNGHHIHILGSFANIKVARDAISCLIIGSPPGKIYAKLRNVANRVVERF